MKIVNPLNYPSWNEMVAHQGTSTFFHTENWARVLHESYGYTPVYFTESENNRISVLLPFMEVRSALTGIRGVSLPFTDSCEPFLIDRKWMEQLSLSVTAYGKKAGWKFIEMRDWPAVPDQYASTQYYGHSLSLTRPEEIIFSQFRESTRRNIKKALKTGVTTSVSTSREAMEQFRQINLITRKKHGLPPQPDRFFKKVSEHIIEKGLGIIVLASYRGNIIAGSIFFHFGSEAIFKYGASNHTYQDLRANNLVMWEGIRWYQTNGYHKLSLGRTELQNDGLRQFKAGWCTEERTIQYYRYDLQSNVFVTGEQKISGLHNKVFSIMPAPILRLTSNLLYRHMG
jgi:hypothetical protein